MVSQVKQESPLNQIDLSPLENTEVLQVKELPFKGYIIIRGEASDASFLSACRKVLGADLPVEANTKITSNGADLLWYGPNEWLVITAAEQVDEIVTGLKSALEGLHSSVVDISGGNTMLEVGGSAARDLLAKGTPFDLHASVFQLGECAQTVLAKTAATIYPVGEGDQFRLVIRRSFADYLGVWLLDAAQEFLQDS